jgi:cysteinyl-tRNA synthetase
MNTFIFDLLGLIHEGTESSSHKELLDKVIQILLQQRHAAKIRKDYAASDSIRNQLTALGISVKDTKDGAEWELD